MASNRAWPIRLESAAVVACVGMMAFLAMGQSYSDGPPGGTPSGAKAPPATIAASGLGDMLQVPPARVTSAPREAVQDLEQTSSSLPAPVSLAERLHAWDDATRRNAQLDVELPAGVPAATVDLAHEIEALWSAGQYDWAIARLQGLEASGTPAALGVAWRTPQPVTNESAFTDVRIGTRTGGVSSGLDYDTATGKLFAVVRWDSDNGWAVHGSNTDGESWAELYFWYAGSGEHAVDVDMAVVSGYVYVGYVASDVASEARLRRVVVSTDQVDSTYGYQVVLDSGANTITDVTVASNADSSNNRVYYAVRQSNNAVRYAWDVSTSGSTFTETSPAGTAAVGGLDLCWNPGFAAYYLFLSYIGTDSRVHVLRYRSTTGWSEAMTVPFDGTHNRSAISAWDDHVICVHELQMTHGQGIRYFISHDGGGTWDIYNYIAEPESGEGPYQMADVTARGGAGTAIVFTHEVGEPDDVLVRYRRGYAPGLWHAAVRVNSNDVATGSWTALNWTPRDTESTTELSYGLIYLNGAIPHFHRFQCCSPGDCNEDGLLDVEDFAAFAGCMFGPRVPAGSECTCSDFDEDENVDLADFAAFQSTFGQP